MIGHTLWHNEELHNIILEGIIKGKRRRGKPRTSYLSQLIKNIKFDLYRQLKDKTHARYSSR